MRIQVSVFFCAGCSVPQFVCPIDPSNSTIFCCSSNSSFIIPHLHNSFLFQYDVTRSLFLYEGPEKNCILVKGEQLCIDCFTSFA